MANQKLPGFTISMRDGGLVPVVPTSTTDRLLIIGNALDGPRNRPVVVRTLSEAEELFGPLLYKGDYKNPITSSADSTYADNNLMKALQEALLGGAANIILCRSGGNYATATNTFSASITISSIHPGRIYNGVSVTTSSGASGYVVTVVQPSSKNGTIVYSFDNNKSIGDVCNIINTDTRNQTIIMLAPPGTALNLITSLGIGTATLSGGTNGTAAPGEDNATSKNTYYTRLTETYGTFDSLVDTEFDVCFLAGIYGDDQVLDTGATTTTSVALDFATFLYKVTKETTPCHGVLALRPSGLRTPAELTTLANNNYLNPSSGFYNSNARWISFGYFMYNGFYYTDLDSDLSINNQQVDVGRFLSVIAGPDIILSNKDMGYYLENAGAVYAGMICNLPAQSATTNKPLGTVKNLVGIFPKAIHELLNQGVGRDQNSNNLGSAAYVTLKTNNTIGRPIVISDNTAAQRKSDYSTLQILRIASLATRLTKIVMQPFLGEGNSTEIRAAMRTQLNMALNKMVDAGALLGGEGTGYSFTISSDIVGMTLGQIVVTLFLRPAIEIKFIKIDVAVGQ